MAIAQWNDAEDDALQGLPHEAQLLYLRGLRRMMDFRTGEVGRTVKISWNGLRDVVYVEPQRGCKDTGSPSRERVRRLGAHLIRAGLVEMRSKMDAKQLIFFLPFADRDKSARKQPDRNPTEQADTAQTKQGKASGVKPDNSKTAKPDRYPISDKTTSTVYITEISAREEETPKASAGGEEVSAVRPEVALAVALRELGVDVLPLNPLLSNWVAELKVTEEECRQAVALSRKHLGDARIPAKYLDKVLRSQRNPSPDKQSKVDRRRQAYRAMTGKSVAKEVGDVVDA